MTERETPWILLYDRNGTWSGAVSRYCQRALKGTEVLGTGSLSQLAAAIERRGAPLIVFTETESAVERTALLELSERLPGSRFIELVRTGRDRQPHLATRPEFYADINLSEDLDQLCTEVVGEELMVQRQLQRVDELSSPRKKLD